MKALNYQSIWLIFTFIISSNIIMAQNPWAQKTDMPTSRYVLTSSTVDGKVYTMGGSQGGPALMIVEEYNPVTNTWTRKSNMPMVRAAGTSSVVNGKIFVMGGRNNFDDPDISPFVVYNPTTDNWIVKDTMLTARSWLSSSVVNGKIYVIGGANDYEGSPLATVEEYDPATGFWTLKEDMPTARVNVSTSVVNGKIYAIGGSRGNNEWYTSVTTVEEYDPEKNTWLKKADMPARRIPYFSTCAVNGKIYVFGEIIDNNVSTCVEEYDPETDTWTRKADIPIVRKGSSTSAVNNKIYIIGGWTDSDISLSEAYEYDTRNDLTDLVDYVEVDKNFAVPGTDTLLITTKMHISSGISLLAELENPDQTPVDILQLYDDGNHYDGNAGDSLFANIWPLFSAEEKTFYLDLIVTRIDTDTAIHQFNNASFFTTIGPLVIDSLNLVGTVENSLFFSIELRNKGLSAAASNVKLKMSSNDTLVKNIQNNSQIFGDIAAGETGTCSNYYLVATSALPASYSIPFYFDIYSNGNYFWTDSISIDIITGINKDDVIIPNEFNLKQNYPNPFNPKTTINYRLPSISQVDLSIYDITGKRVETLVNKKQPNGIYKVEWDASGFSSGMYFYKLETNKGFIQSKKMILLK